MAAINALTNFHEDVIIMHHVDNIVPLLHIEWNVLQVDAHIFFTVKRCTQIEIFDFCRQEVGMLRHNRVE